MRRTKDELPVKAIVKAADEIVTVMEEVATEAATDISKAEVAEHERRLHRPLSGPRYDIPTALPFQDEHIPDDILSQIAERLQPNSDGETTEDLDSVSRAFGYSPLLVERELSRFLGANKRFNVLLRG
jgi:hypothetical protein